MKILDWYIIKKFLGTYGFMLGLLSIIVLVIDVQAKAPRIESSGFTVTYFLIHFYPFWILYLVMTFMAILVFISVIFFTSRLANNTEIVAIISSGASFHRFARPYWIAGIFIASVTLFINHYALPWANVKKNKLEYYTYNNANMTKFTSNQVINTQLSKNEYLFINSFNKQAKRGSGYLYQKFDKNKKLIYQVSGSDVSWDEKKKVFVVGNYMTRKAGPNDTEILTDGAQLDQDFGHTPEELFPDELLAQTKTTPELKKMIEQEKQKGNKDVNTYLNELYMRTSMPIAIIILTVLGLSLASEKKRGGIGMNLAIGISLAFIFVFSFQVLQVVSENKTLPPLFAMWLPNLVYLPIAIYLYLRRANQ